MIPELNAAWRNARDGGATRASTIGLYVKIGLTYEAATELFDFQWERYQENRADPEAGELAVSSHLPFNG